MKEENKLKSLPGIFFLVILVLVPIVSFLLPDQDLSLSERRSLKQLPEFRLEDLESGDYMEDMEAYLLDQFVAREGLRTGKAMADLWLFQKKNTDGYFQVGEHIFQLDYALEEENILQAAKGFQRATETYFTDTDVYYSVIPDKNFYLEAEGIPSLDYENMEALVEENFVDGVEISMQEQLDLDSYYETDLHWKQEELLDVVETLVRSMNADWTVEMEIEYESFVASESFRGGLWAASALLSEEESLRYLTSESMEHAKVFDYEEDAYVSMYQLEKLQGVDPYDIFLGGARALQVIENEEAVLDQSLLLFRDSFGSSIAPLLSSYYTEIVLVDLRYTTLSYAMTLLEGKSFDDVLFLYNVLLLQNSDSMRFY